MNYPELYIGTYKITPLFLFLLAGALVGIVTLFLLYRHRKIQGVKYWLLLQLATSIWSFTYAFEFASINIETKLLWSEFSYFGIIYCSVSFLFFSLEYSGQNRYVNKKSVLALYAIATLFLIFPFTNSTHHLLWKSYSIIPETNAMDYSYGPVFWFIYAFSYLNILIGIINIIVFYFRLSKENRRQILILILATLAPVFGNLIYVLHINPVPGFDWTPFAFLITGILIAINISHYKFFDLVPFGRSKLIDMLPDAIFILDNSMRIADFNPAMQKLIGADNPNLNGQNIDKYFPQRQDIIDEIRNKDEVNTVITRDSNNKTFFLDLQSTTLLDHHHQKKGRLVVLKDITERVLAEQHIKDANNRLKLEIQEKEKLIVDLDSFSHTVAHDLKNNLGIIVSASDLMRMGIDELPREELLEVTEMIYMAANQTIHITKELLTLASVRQEEIKISPLEMKDTVTDALLRLKLMIQENNASISYPEVWPRVLGYKSWLEQVWINYISNAIKYGGKPAVMILGFDELPNNQIKFWIKDNGKGLSKSDISLLFNKFTRLDSLRAEGHGLGLSIVKRIVEKLNGEVGVESENIPGEGCVFYFILPLAKD